MARAERPASREEIRSDVEVTEGMRPDDERFVFDTWARAFRVAPACLELPQGAFYAWHRKRMERIMTRGPLVLVARSKADPLFIYGYGIFERVGDAFVAHWVMCKSHFKKHSIGSLLLLRALERIAPNTTRRLMTHRTYFEPKALEMGFENITLDELYSGGERHAHHVP